MVSTLVLTFIACHERMTEATDAPKMALKIALEALENDDYETYMSCVDYASDMDSMQMRNLCKVLRFHMSKQRAAHAPVVDIDMIDAVLKGDTVCTVYYQYTFADSVKEVASQKMVRKNGEWKLRLRN